MLLSIIDRYCLVISDKISFHKKIKNYVIDKFIKKIIAMNEKCCNR